MDKKFLATAFTLTGSIIGAGFLGIPYVVAQSGFAIGVFWIIFLGIIITYLLLCASEATLRTKKDHQLVGLAQKYLGKKGKWAMLCVAIFGIYSALLAYLIGEGQSLAMLFTNSTTHAGGFVLVFWIALTLLLREGLRTLKKVETYGVIVVIIVFISITFKLLPQINIQNLTTIHYANFFTPFGVILFALIGFSAIPELRMIAKGQEKIVKNAVILGATIPILAYLLFAAVFVGVLGTNVPQVATLGLGNLVILLGVFTMFTSYFVLSFALLDLFRLDLKFKKRESYALVTIIPLLLYLFLDRFGQLNFIQVLGIGGTISGGLTAMLILLIAKKAKEKGERKPEFSIPVNWPIIIVVAIIFLLGLFTQLF